MTMPKASKTRTPNPVLNLAECADFCQNTSMAWGKLDWTVLRNCIWWGVFLYEYRVDYHFKSLVYRWKFNPRVLSTTSGPGRATNQKKDPLGGSERAVLHQEKVILTLTEQGWRKTRKDTARMNFTSRHKKWENLIWRNIGYSKKGPEMIELMRLVNEDIGTALMSMFHLFWDTQRKVSTVRR
jgi:hypothetical protein